MQFLTFYFSNTIQGTLPPARTARQLPLAEVAPQRAMFAQPHSKELGPFHAMLANPHSFSANIKHILIRFILMRDQG